MNSIPLENYSSYIMLYTPQEIQLDPNGSKWYVLHGYKIGNSCNSPWIRTPFLLGLKLY